MGTDIKLPWCITNVFKLTQDNSIETESKEGKRTIPIPPERFPEVKEIVNNLRERGLDNITLMFYFIDDKLLQMDFLVGIDCMGMVVEQTVARAFFSENFPNRLQKRLQKYWNSIKKCPV